MGEKIKTGQSEHSIYACSDTKTQCLHGVGSLKSVTLTVSELNSTATKGSGRVFESTIESLSADGVRIPTSNTDTNQAPDDCACVSNELVKSRILLPRKDLPASTVFYDVWIERQLPARLVRRTQTSIFNIFTPFIARLQSGRRRGDIVVLMCPGGEYAGGSSHDVIVAMSPDTTFLSRGRYRVKAIPDSSSSSTFFIVSVGNQEAGDLLPLGIQDLGHGLDNIKATDLACWDKLFINPIGRFTGGSPVTIPALWFTPEFVALQEKIGKVGDWPDMYDQAIDAQTRWSSTDGILWNEKLIKGDSISVAQPDQDAVAPGTDNIYLHTHPDVFKYFGLSKRGATIVYITKGKWLYNCNYAWGIREIRQTKTYINDHTEWNQEPMPNEYSYNFQWVAQHEFGAALGLGLRPWLCTSKAPFGIDPYFNAYMKSDVGSGFLSHAKIRGKAPFPNQTLDPDDIDRMDRLYQAVTETPPKC